MFIANPESRIRIFAIPDPGAKKAPDPGTGSATLGYFRIFFGTDTENPNPYLYNSYNAVVFEHQKVTDLVRPKSGTFEKKLPKIPRQSWKTE
jgi:hypothetical protein